MPVEFGQGEEEFAADGTFERSAEVGDEAELCQVDFFWKNAGKFHGFDSHF